MFVRVCVYEKFYSYRTTSGHGSVEIYCLFSSALRASDFTITFSNKYRRGRYGSALRVHSSFLLYQQGLKSFVLRGLEVWEVGGLQV